MYVGSTRHNWPMAKWIDLDWLTDWQLSLTQTYITVTDKKWVKILYLYRNNLFSERGILFTFTFCSLYFWRNYVVMWTVVKCNRINVHSILLPSAMALFDKTYQAKASIDDTEQLVCNIENAQNINKHTVI